MQEFEELKALVEEAADEIDKVNKGNKAAGTRLRKQMQKVKAAAQAVRVKSLEMRDAQSSTG